MTAGRRGCYGATMPIQPNVLERTAFFTLNAAPGPMLDLGGLLGYLAFSTAVQLDLFRLLEDRPASATDLARRLDAQERGLDRLLQALDALGYVQQQNGHYVNTDMTRKWFLQGAGLDMVSAVTKGTPVQCDGHEGRKSVAIFNAVYESSRTGQVIELD